MNTNGGYFSFEKLDSYQVARELVGWVNGLLKRLRAAGAVARAEGELPPNRRNLRELRRPPLSPAESPRDGTRSARTT